MVRVLAEFDDRMAAFAAIHALVAASFSVDDLELRALRPDGSSPVVPIRERSHVVHGFAIGSLVGMILGGIVGITTTETGRLASYVAVGAGVGAAAGAAIGIGSWSVSLSRRDVPADATGFVAVVLVPEGRAPSAEAVLRRMGGRDASPRLLSM